MLNAPLHQLDHAGTTHDVGRLELLLPQHVRPVSRELRAYALAFAEWYKDDILQLEHEWNILYAALMSSWQRSEYDAVVRLVAALAYPMSRVCTLAEVEHILRIGIEASSYLQDKQHLTSFLSCLGCLLFSHGRYWQGRRLWYEAVQHTTSSAGFARFWEPLSSFACVTDIIGGYVTSQSFTAPIFYTLYSDDAESISVVLFARGLRARLMNDVEQAYKDFSTCLQFLSAISTDSTTSCTARKLFTLVVQTELARTRGDYMRSQGYTESALLLAEVFSDRYTVAALLADQALFTYTQGHIEDTYAVFLRLRDIAHQLDIPHIYNCSHFLEQRLAEVLQENHVISPGFRETLSTREMEVLQLVAEGLSNREIANQLVVTQGTVKKHLEHIYNKLDVCSRTSALAKAKTLKILSV